MTRGDSARPPPAFAAALIIAIGAATLAEWQPIKPVSGQQYQCQSEGFHVNPADCARFVRCVDQFQNGHLTAYHFSCPAGKSTARHLRAIAFTFDLRARNQFL